MRTFEIERDVESVPKIAGIRSMYAFIFFIVFIFGLFITFVNFNVIKLVIAVFLVGGTYVVLYWMTETFQANSLSDGKIPDEISNNP